MSPFFKSAIVIVFTLISLNSFCADTSFAVSTTNDNDVPENYLHQNVINQIARYRQLYSDALTPCDGNFETMRKGPIAGLRAIANNAFALTHYVLKKRGHGQTEALQHHMLMALTELWETFNAHRGDITSKQFQLLNFQLALIVEYFNHQQKITPEELAFPFPSNDIFFDGNRSSEQPFFIIYAHPVEGPRRGILTNHFVEQYYHHDFPGYLAFFDVLSVRKTAGSRADVHYSTQNGTHRLLKHDFDHYARGDRGLVRAIKPDSVAYQFEQQLWNFATTSSSIDHNERKIIIYGLFFASHESAEFPQLYRIPQLKDKHYRELVGCYTAKGFLRSTPLNWVGMDNYLRNSGDWEFYFSTTNDENGQPFFDAHRVEVSSSARHMSTEYHDALINAYDNFWKCFREIAMKKPNMNAPAQLDAVNGDVRH